jgi:alpha-tubulin suppressor-like RCC1 family protein
VFVALIAPPNPVEAVGYMTSSPENGGLKSVAPDIKLQNDAPQADYMPIAAKTHVVAGHNTIVDVKLPKSAPTGTKQLMVNVKTTAISEGYLLLIPEGGQLDGRQNLAFPAGTTTSPTLIELTDLSQLVVISSTDADIEISVVGFFDGNADDASKIGAGGTKTISPITLLDNRRSIGVDLNSTTDHIEIPVLGLDKGSIPVRTRDDEHPVRALWVNVVSSSGTKLLLKDVDFTGNITLTQSDFNGNIASSTIVTAVGYVKNKAIGDDATQIPQGVTPICDTTIALTDDLSDDDLLKKIKESSGTTPVSVVLSVPTGNSNEIQIRDLSHATISDINTANAPPNGPPESLDDTNSEIQPTTNNSPENQQLPTPSTPNTQQNQQLPIKNAQIVSITLPLKTDTQNKLTPEITLDPINDGMQMDANKQLSTRLTGSVKPNATGANIRRVELFAGETFLGTGNLNYKTASKDGTVKWDFLTYIGSTKSEIRAVAVDSDNSSQVASETVEPVPLDPNTVQYMDDVQRITNEDTLKRIAQVYERTITFSGTEPIQVTKKDAKLNDVFFDSGNVQHQTIQVGDILLADPNEQYNIPYGLAQRVVAIEKMLTKTVLTVTGAPMYEIFANVDTTVKQGDKIPMVETVLPQKYMEENEFGQQVEVDENSWMETHNQLEEESKALEGEDLSDDDVLVTDDGRKISAQALENAEVAQESESYDPDTEIVDDVGSVDDYSSQNTEKVDASPLKGSGTESDPYRRIATMDVPSNNKDPKINEQSAGFGNKLVIPIKLRLCLSSGGNDKNNRPNAPKKLGAEDVKNLVSCAKSAGETTEDIRKNTGTDNPDKRKGVGVGGIPKNGLKDSVKNAWNVGLFGYVEIDITVTVGTETIKEHKAVNHSAYSGSSQISVERSRDGSKDVTKIEYKLEAGGGGFVSFNLNLISLDICFTIGPVPVMIRIAPSISFEATLSAAGSIGSSSIKEHSIYTESIIKNQKVVDHKEVDKPSHWNTSKPQITGTLSVSLSASLNLLLGLYVGNKFFAIGVTVTGSGFIALKASISFAIDTERKGGFDLTLHFIVTAGANACIGLDISIFSFSIFTIQTCFNLFTWTLFDAEITYYLTGDPPDDPADDPVDVDAGETENNSNKPAYSKPGAIWGVGDNSHGQIGNGTTSAAKTPELADGTQNFQKVVTTSSPNTVSTFGLDKSGNVWSWGDNSSGQLGRCAPNPFWKSGVDSDNTRNLPSNNAKCDPSQNKNVSSQSGEVPSKVVTESGVPLTGITDIKAADDFIIALTSSGLVYYWGKNVCKDSCTTDNSTNIPYAAHVPLLNSVKKIGAGGSTAMFERKDGTIWTWGKNITATSTTNTIPKNTKFTPDSSSNTNHPVLEQIEITDSNAYFLYSQDGQTPKTAIYGVGDCMKGQFAGEGCSVSGSFSVPAQIKAISDSTKIHIPSDEEEESDANSPIKQIAANSASVYALKEDGRVYSWGDNSNGQLGYGCKTGESGCNFNDKPIRTISKLFLPMEDSGEKTNDDPPKPIYKALGVSSIAAGKNFGAAVLTNGQVVSWGDCSHTRIWQGCTSGVSYPFVLPGTDHIANIATGDKNIFIVRDDATIARKYGTPAAWNADYWDFDSLDNVFKKPNIGKIVTTKSGISVGLDEDQKLWTWDNSAEPVVKTQVTDVDVEPSNYDPKANPGGQFQLIQDIVAGDEFFAALDDSGQILQWVPKEVENKLTGQMSANDVKKLISTEGYRLIAASGNTIFAVEGSYDNLSNSVKKYTCNPICDNPVPVTLSQPPKESAIRQLESANSELYALFWPTVGSEKETKYNESEGITGTLVNYGTMGSNAPRWESPGNYTHKQNVVNFSVENGAGYAIVKAQNPSQLMPYDIYAFGNNAKLTNTSQKAKNTLYAGNNFKRIEFPSYFGYTFKKVVTDGTSVLALTDDSEVVKWGGPAELKDKIPTEHISDYRFPSQLDHIDTAVDIFGGNKAFALLADAQTNDSPDSDYLYSWGKNSQGELGVGTNIDEFSPVQATAVSGKKIKSVSSSSGTTFAVLDDGTVRAWGDNSAGQLGIGAITDLHDRFVTVQGLNNIVKVVTSAKQALALDEDGDIYFWGDNPQGVLGTNPGENQFLPKRYDWLGHFADITAYEGNTFGVRHNGTVVDLAVGEISEIHHIRTDTGSIAATDNGVIAVNDDGEIWEFKYGKEGATTYERIGASAFGKTTGLRAKSVYYKRGYDQIGNRLAPGKGTYIALDNLGSIWGWGADDYLFIKDANNYENERYLETPTQFTGVPTSYVDSIAMTNSSIHAVTLGRYVYSWGAGDHGQKGDGSMHPNNDASYRPAYSLPNVNHAHGIWAGDDNVFLSGDMIRVDEPTGVVYALGNNDNCTLAVTENEDEQCKSKTPETVSTLQKLNDYAPVANNKEESIEISAKQIVTNGRTTIAVSNDGKVYQWGEELLNDAKKGELSPTKTTNHPKVVGKISNAVQVAITQNQTGPNTGYALKSDGTIWSWGSNNNGLLGANNSDAPDRQTGQPNVVWGMTDVISIAAGENAAIASYSDGRTFTWGANDRCQLGTADRPGAVYNKPTQINGVTAGKKVAVGGKTMYALTNNGEIYAWGDNTENQNGLNYATQNDTWSFFKDVQGSVQCSPELVMTGSEDGSLANVNVTGALDIVTDNETAYFSTGRSHSYQIYTWGKKHEWMMEHSVDRGVHIAQKLAGADYQNTHGFGAGGGFLTTAQTLTKNNQNNTGFDVLNVFSGGSNNNAKTYAITNRINSANDEKTNIWVFGDEGSGVRGVDDGKGCRPLEVTNSGYNYAHQLQDCGIANGRLAQKVVTGKESSYALMDDGTILSWGKNTYGQLGHGGEESEDIQVPRFVTAPHKKGDTPTDERDNCNGLLCHIVTIAANDYAAYAISKSGVIYSWGDNSKLQLGNNSTTTKFASSPEFVYYRQKVSKNNRGGCDCEGYFGFAAADCIVSDPSEISINASGNWAVITVPKRDDGEGKGNNVNDNSGYFIGAGQFSSATGRKVTNFDIFDDNGYRDGGDFEKNYKDIQIKKIMVSGSNVHVFTDKDVVYSCSNDQITDDSGCSPVSGADSKVMNPSEMIGAGDSNYTLSESGLVFAWGSNASGNSYGQLSSGSTGNISSPELILGENLGKVDSIAANGESALFFGNGDVYAVGKQTSKNILGTNSSLEFLASSTADDPCMNNCSVPVRSTILNQGQNFTSGSLSSGGFGVAIGDIPTAPVFATSTDTLNTKVGEKVSFDLKVTSAPKLEEVSIDPNVTLPNGLELYSCSEMKKINGNNGWKTSDKYPHDKQTYEDECANDDKAYKVLGIPTTPTDQSEHKPVIVTFTATDVSHKTSNYTLYIFVTGKRPAFGIQDNSTFELEVGKPITPIDLKVTGEGLPTVKLDVDSKLPDGLRFDPNSKGCNVENSGITNKQSTTTNKTKTSETDCFIIGTPTSYTSEGISTKITATNGYRDGENEPVKDASVTLKFSFKEPEHYISIPDVITKSTVENINQSFQVFGCGAGFDDQSKAHVEISKKGGGSGLDILTAVALSSNDQTCTDPIKWTLQFKDMSKTFADFGAKSGDILEFTAKYYPNAGSDPLLEKNFKVQVLDIKPCIEFSTKPEEIASPYCVDQTPPEIRVNVGETLEHPLIIKGSPMPKVKIDYPTLIKKYDNNAELLQDSMSWIYFDDASGSLKTGGITKDMIRSDDRESGVSHYHPTIKLYSPGYLKDHGEDGTRDYDYVSVTINIDVHGFAPKIELPDEQSRKIEVGENLDSTTSAIKFKVNALPAAAVSVTVQKHTYFNGDEVPDSFAYHSWLGFDDGPANEGTIEPDDKDPSYYIYSTRPVNSIEEDAGIYNLCIKARNAFSSAGDDCDQNLDVFVGQKPHISVNESDLDITSGDFFNIPLNISGYPYAKSGKVKISCVREPNKTKNDCDSQLQEHFKITSDGSGHPSFRLESEVEPQLQVGRYEITVQVETVMGMDTVKITATVNGENAKLHIPSEITAHYTNSISQDIAATGSPCPEVAAEDLPEFLTLKQKDPNDRCKGYRLSRDENYSPDDASSKPYSLKFTATNQDANDEQVTDTEMMDVIITGSKSPEFHTTGNFSPTVNTWAQINLGVTGTGKVTVNADQSTSETLSDLDLKLIKNHNGQWIVRGIPKSVGSYTLKFIAVNQDGEIASTIIKLNITGSKPMINPINLGNNSLYGYSEDSFMINLGVSGAPFPTVEFSWRSTGFDDVDLQEHTDNWYLTGTFPEEVASVQHSVTLEACNKPNETTQCTEKTIKFNVTPSAEDPHFAVSDLKLNVEPESYFDLPLHLLSDDNYAVRIDRESIATQQAKLEFGRASNEENLRLGHPIANIGPDDKMHGTPELDDIEVLSHPARLTGSISQPGTYIVDLCIYKVKDKASCIDNTTLKVTITVKEAVHPARINQPQRNHSATEGNFMSLDLDISGTPWPEVSVTTASGQTGLPLGMKLEGTPLDDWSIVGVPTVPGHYSFTVTATNKNGAVSREMTISVADKSDPFSMHILTNPKTIDIAYLESVSIPISTTGSCPANITMSVNQLQPQAITNEKDSEFKLDGRCSYHNLRIIGIASVINSAHELIVTASDKDGKTIASITLQINVKTDFQISIPKAVNAYLGDAINIPVNVLNGHLLDCDITVTGLPEKFLKYDSTTRSIQQISGKSTQSGTWEIKVVANAKGTKTQLDSKTMQLSIIPTDLKLDVADTTYITVGDFLDLPIYAYGRPYPSLGVKLVNADKTETEIPDFLKLVGDESDGYHLSGKWSEDVHDKMKFRVTATSGKSVISKDVVIIQKDQDLRFNFEETLTSRVGEYINFDLAITGSKPYLLQYTNLPEGLSVSSNNHLVGTIPGTTPNNYQITFTLKDSEDENVTKSVKSVMIHVVDNELQFVGENWFTTTLNHHVEYPISTSPYCTTITPVRDDLLYNDFIASGLNLSGNCLDGGYKISGNTNVIGKFMVNLKTNSGVTQTYTVQVNSEGVAFGAPSIASISVGQSVQIPLQVTGSPCPTVTIESVDSNGAAQDSSSFIVSKLSNSSSCDWVLLGDLGASPSGSLYTIHLEATQEGSAQKVEHVITLTVKSDAPEFHIDSANTIVPDNGYLDLNLGVTGNPKPKIEKVQEIPNVNCSWPSQLTLKNGRVQGFVSFSDVTDNQSESFTICLRASNSGAEKLESVKVFVVGQQPKITAKSNWSLTVDSHEQIDLGVAKTAYSTLPTVIDGELPPGLSIRESTYGTYEISGTVSALGYYHFTICAQNVIGTTVLQDTKLFIVNVAGTGIHFFPQGDITAVVNQNISIDLGVTGNPSPTDVRLESIVPALEDGSTLEIVRDHRGAWYLTGSIHSVGNTSGVYNVTVVASVNYDGKTKDIPETFPIKITQGAPTFNIPNKIHIPALHNQIINLGLKSNNQDQLVVTAGSLPPGLKLQSDGDYNYYIVGAAKNAGTYNSTVTAQLGGNIVTENIEFTVSFSDVTISPDNISHVTVGQSVQLNIPVSGSPCPQLRIKEDDDHKMPSWMHLIVDSLSCKYKLVGVVPLELPEDLNARSVSFTVEASNDDWQNISKAPISFEIQGAAPKFNYNDSEGIINITAGKYEDIALNVTGSPCPIVSFAEGSASNLPDGLELVSDCTSPLGSRIVGTVTAPEQTPVSFTVKLKAQNTVSEVVKTAETELTFMVHSSVPDIHINPSLTATIGKQFTAKLGVTGNPTPKIVFHDLPEGISQVGDSDVIRGVPYRAGGPYKFSVTLEGETSKRFDLELTVEGQIPAFHTLSDTVYLVQNDYSRTKLGVTGSGCPEVSSSNLPDGLKLTGDCNLGFAIVGVPKVVGSSIVTLTASNGSHADHRVNYDLTINIIPSTPSINTTGEKSITVSKFTSIDLGVTGHPMPEVSILTGSLPHGLHLVKRTVDVSDDNTPKTLNAQLLGQPDSETTELTSSQRWFIEGIVQDKEGDYTVNLQAVNSSDGSSVGFKTITLHVYGTFPALHAGNISGLSGDAVNVDLNVTGAPFPDVEIIDGELPDGLKLVQVEDSWRLIGMLPDEEKLYNFTLQANTGSHASEPVHVALDIKGQSPIARVDNYYVLESKSYFEHDLDIVAFPAVSDVFIEGKLPAGLILTLDGKGARIEGKIESEAGAYDVMIHAVNSAGEFEKPVHFEVVKKSAPDIKPLNNPADSSDAVAQTGVQSTTLILLLLLLLLLSMAITWITIQKGGNYDNG